MYITSLDPRNLWARCYDEENLNRKYATNAVGSQGFYTSVDNCLTCPRLHKGSDSNPNFKAMLIRCKGADTFKKMYPAWAIKMLKSDVGMTPDIDKKQTDRKQHELVVRKRLELANEQVLNEEDDGPITLEHLRSMLDRR